MADTNIDETKTAPRPANGGSRPIPDPTELTDRAIAKAIASLTDYIDGQFEVRDERLRGIDKATELRLQQVTTVHDSITTDIDRAVDARASVVDEKFSSIQTQFKERDTRAERESKDNKVAVDAAFAAQKEAATKQDEANAKAIDKSEKATAETIKTNQELSKSTTDSLTKQLDEVKIAIARIDSTKVGGQETQQRSDLTTSRLITIGLGVLAGVYFLLNFVKPT